MITIQTIIDNQVGLPIWSLKPQPQSVPATSLQCQCLGRSLMISRSQSNYVIHETVQKRDPLVGRVTVFFLHKLVGLFLQRIIYPCLVHMQIWTYT